MVPLMGDKMTLDKALIWIEFDPTTGSVRPWEVWSQVQREGAPMRRVSSCTTEEKARKSMQALIRRSDGWCEMRPVDDVHAAIGRELSKEKEAANASR